MLKIRALLNAITDSVYIIDTGIMTLCKNSNPETHTILIHVQLIYRASHFVTVPFLLYLNQIIYHHHCHMLMFKNFES